VCWRRNDRCHVGGDCKDFGERQTPTLLIPAELGPVGAILRAGRRTIAPCARRYKRDNAFYKDWDAISPATETAFCLVKTKVTRAGTGAFAGIQRVPRQFTAACGGKPTGKSMAACARTDAAE